MANIVTHGLGQPDEGAIVALGMGASEPAPPGAMSATLTGSGALTATISDGGTPPVETGGGWGWTQHHIDLLHAQQALEQQQPRPPVVGVLSANLRGTCRVFAEATATEHAPTGFDDLALLLTLELV